MKSDKLKQVIVNRKPSVKWVKKAGRWCKTTWKNGKQYQEWFGEKPNETQESTTP